MSSELMRAAEDSIVWLSAPTPYPSPQPKRSKKSRIAQFLPAIPGLRISPLVDAASRMGEQAARGTDQDSLPDTEVKKTSIAAIGGAIARSQAELATKAGQALGDLEARGRHIIAAASHSVKPMVGTPLLVLVIVLFVFTDMFAFRGVSMDIFGIQEPGRYTPQWMQVMPYAASVALSLVFVMVGLAAAIGLKAISLGRDRMSRVIMAVLAGATGLGILMAAYGLTLNRAAQVERSTVVGQQTAQAVTEQIARGHMLLLGGLALATFAATTLVKYARAYPGLLSKVPDHAEQREHRATVIAEIRGALTALRAAAAAAYDGLCTPELKASLVAAWQQGYKQAAHPSALDRYAQDGVSFAPEPSEIQVGELPSFKALMTAMDDFDARLGRAAAALTSDRDDLA